MSPYQRNQVRWVDNAANQHPSYIVHMLSGGTGINIVPGVASVSVDRRVVGGESAAAVRDALAAFGRDVCEKLLRK